jgi:GNAT superfamily N-acetyltransferase
MYCWRTVQIESLWVDPRYRSKGYGSTLLRKVEEEAHKRGCSLIHLDTFDFQAKDFYLAHAYEVFGVLDGSQVPNVL